ncbi:MAG TPA: hypothetical protein ENJ82_12805 [Bacteroidetes bacterium]|nr:hypothetical protein [Bacteroidota bacterium]
MKKIISTSVLVLFFALTQVFATGPETPTERQQIIEAAAVEMGVSCATLMAADAQGDVSIENVGTSVATGGIIYLVVAGNGSTVFIEEVI